MSANLELVRKTNASLDASVGSDAEGHSSGKAVQSIGQTTAIVVQDAADMLRNVSTVEVTAIGAATAAWIATQDPAYKEIIQNSMDVMKFAAAQYVTIGTNAQQVLSLFSTTKQG